MLRLFNHYAILHGWKRESFRLPARQKMSRIKREENCETRKVSPEINFPSRKSMEMFKKLRNSSRRHQRLRWLSTLEGICSILEPCLISFQADCIFCVAGVCNRAEGAAQWRQSENLIPTFSWQTQLRSQIETLSSAVMKSSSNAWKRDLNKCVETPNWFNSEKEFCFGKKCYKIQWSFSSAGSNERKHSRRWNFKATFEGDENTKFDVVLKKGSLGTERVLPRSEMFPFERRRKKCGKKNVLMKSWGNKYVPGSLYLEYWNFTLPLSLSLVAYHFPRDFILEKGWNWRIVIYEKHFIDLYWMVSRGLLPSAPLQTWIFPLSIPSMFCYISHILFEATRVEIHFKWLTTLRANWKILIFIPVTSRRRAEMNASDAPLLLSTSLISQWYNLLLIDFLGLPGAERSALISSTFIYCWQIVK